MFEVKKGIYQVRGYDLANMTLIEGKNGWIVVDPLTSKETAKAALALANKHLGERPITAIVVTHSHVDHFGGVGGLLEGLKNKNIPIVSPKHFFEEAVSENVLAGYQMGRRAHFMYGSGLPYGKESVVGIGLNQALSSGKVAIVKPNLEITKSGEIQTIDGVLFEFILTPNAEAPAEFMFYLPQHKAFCQAEEINHLMHNLYTLRGAKVRDGLLWSKYINQTIEEYGDKIEVSFGSHHWPVWGKKEVNDFYISQRDLYKYIHDQTLNFANKGFGPLEIAERLKLPRSLDTIFSNRGVYGSLKNNIKAQYQLYYGWFDGNPSNLNRLTPSAEGKKWIEYIGGEEIALRKAKEDYEKGEYRFVATVLGYLVEVNPNNKDAKALLAKTFKQMAYTSEAGPERNFYLSGAKELMDGTQAYAGPKARSREFVYGLTEENIFDAMSVAMNGERAAGKELVINFNFSDNNSKNVLYIKNGVLNYKLGKNEANANAGISITKEAFAKIALEESSYAKEVLSGGVKIKGNLATVLEYSRLIDKFNFDFNLVLPVEQ